MAKIKVEADPALTQHFPRTWPARLSVATSAGAREKLMLHVPGDPERPFGEREIREKFARVVGPLLDENRAAALCESSLGALDSASAVARLLDDVRRASA